MAVRWRRRSNRRAPTFVAGCTSTTNRASAWRTATTAMPRLNSSTAVVNSPRPPASPNCAMCLRAVGSMAATLSASTPFATRESMGSPSRPTTTTASTPLGRQSGAQLTTAEFDSVKSAPSSGYQIDSTVVLSVNSVAIVHSRAVPCSSDLSPVHNFFAKLHVLDIDTTSGPNGRRIDLEILTDINCGYRGLEPGLPKH